MRRLLLTFACLLVATALPAQDPSTGPQIEADTFDIDFATGLAVYRGNARVELDGAVLTADELRYLHADRAIEAQGRVVLTQGAFRLLASAMRYELRDRTYRVQDLRFGSAPIYVSGTLLQGAANSLEFEDARVTYGEPGRWTPTIAADHLQYFPERERMRARGAALGLGLWQFLPIPSTELPTRLSFLSYLSLRAGYYRSLGAFSEIGLHLPVGGVAQLGGEVGYFTARGLLAGPSGTYEGGEGTDYAFRGDFSTGYIHDTGARLIDIRREPIPPHRGFVMWNHHQHFGSRLTLGSVVNYWSDSEVVRDFRPSRFFPIQTPDTFAELNYRGDNTVLGFFLRPQINPYHTVRERLPELTFNLLPTTWGGGLYHELQASAVRLRDDPPAGGDILRSDRIDTYYALTRPFTPREWLTVAPVAGARVTHYDRTQPGSGRSDYTRALGEFGFDAEARASGTFEYRNERWGINGLRHLVTPRLSYRYIPDATKGAAYLPAVDRRVFATYLEPLGLGSRRQIDDLARTHTLRVAIDNRLQTRDGAVGSRDLVRLNFAADLRFDREPGQRQLSDLHTELQVTPARWLALDLYHRLDPHRGATAEFNAGLTLLHADRWSFRLANHYLQSGGPETAIQEHVGAVAYRFNEVFEAFARLHYDARRERFNEQSYGVRQTLDNRWVVGYQVSFFDGRREGNFGFNLLLETIAF